MRLINKLSDDFSNYVIFNIKLLLIIMSQLT
jgi:hypothetical protein